MNNLLTNRTTRGVVCLRQSKSLKAREVSVLLRGPQLTSTHFCSNGFTSTFGQNLLKLSIKKRASSFIPDISKFNHSLVEKCTTDPGKEKNQSENYH